MAPGEGIGVSVRESLAAWRERGAHRLDASRFQIIEALAQRAEAHDGALRLLLDHRLAQLLAAFGERFAAAQGRSGGMGDGGHTGAAPAVAEPPPRPGPLGQLVQQLGGPSRDAGIGPSATGRVVAALASAGPPSELKALRFFRSTWSRLSVEQQLSRSLAKAPGNAGPLNSHRLVLRALQAMQALSPDYLNRFMSQVQALLWLDQAGSGPAVPPAKAARGAGEKKRRPGRSGGA